MTVKRHFPLLEIITVSHVKIGSLLIRARSFIKSEICNTLAKRIVFPS